MIRQPPEQMTDEPACPVGESDNLSSVICYLSFRRAESEAMNPPMSQAFTCDRAPGLPLVLPDP